MLNHYLNAPYRVRLFILVWKDKNGLCGQELHAEHLIQILKQYSPAYYSDSSFGDMESTSFEHVIRGEYIKGGWDGELIDRLWEEVVKALDSDFVHEFS